MTIYILFPINKIKIKNHNAQLQLQRSIDDTYYDKI